MSILDDLKSNSLAGKDAPTIMDGVNKVYETVTEIKQTLDKSGTSSPSSEESVFSDNDRKELLHFFKTIISENKIIEFLNADPESEIYYELCVNDVVIAFIEKIKREVIAKFVELQDEDIYSNIRIFAELLGDYFVFISERVSISEDGKHYILNHEEVKVDNIRQAVERKLTAREEVRGLLPQKPSIFDGKGMLKVRKLDNLYYEITGKHLLYGTKWGGWVDRDFSDEASEGLINSLFSYASQKETVAEQMIDVFRFAVDKCQIVKYIKCDPTHRLEFPVVQIDYFMYTMDELFDKYRHNQKESVYNSIFLFTEKLREYNSFLSCNMWLLRDDVIDVFVPNPPGAKKMSWQEEQMFEKKTQEYRREIDELYGKVCTGETMFV